MAEFGVNATELSAPQNAGARALQGIETAPSGVVIPQALANLGSTVIKGAIEDQKKKPNPAVIAYQTDLTSVVQAVESGAISYEEGRVRTRALGTQYGKDFAGNPELLKEFKAVKEALTGISTLSDIDDQRQRNLNIEDQEIRIALDLGFQIPQSATPSQRRAILDSAMEMHAAEQKFARMSKRSAEVRAENSDNRAGSNFLIEQDERLAQKEAWTIINSVASTQIDTAMAYGQNFYEQVSAGTMDLKTAQINTRQYFAGVRAQLQAAAGSNPQFASAWQTIFTDLEKANMELIDPSIDRTAAEDQLKLIKTRAITAALQNDPSLLGFVVTSDLLPNSPIANLDAAPAITGMLAKFTQYDLDNPTRLPQLVASSDKATEKGTYDVLGAGLKNIQIGTIDSEQGKTEVSNSVNAIMSQVGSLINDQSVKDVDLKEVSAFMASPSFAYAVKEGMLDATSREAAKNTWQIKYQNSVRKGIQAKLNEQVAESFISNREFVWTDGAKREPVTLGQVIDVEFTGSGVTFVPIKDERIQGRGVQYSQMTGELNKMKQGINQLIRIGAHLEGTTDYKKYWEENKFRILPDFYADPSRLKEGDVVDGMRFKGGRTNVQSNWEPVDNGNNQ